jgi:acetolactate synthase I/II/III large subunit
MRAANIEIKKEEVAHLKVSEAIVKCLVEENVKVIFGYPGATVVPLYEALRTCGIRHILARHEQAAGHSASGYARASGKVGVCMATSGPGATNIMTAVATAYMDSIPLVVITGQVRTDQIGKDVFQEADVTGATASFTKHNYLVKESKDILRIFKEAFYIARTGRPGPVLIDIPVNIQNEEIEFDYPEEVNIRGYKPTVQGHKGQIKKAIELIRHSKRPIICIGGGVISSNAKMEVAEFVEKAKIPVVHTLMGKDGINSDSPYYVGLIGTHGFSDSNKAVSKADILILLGTRVADRATAGPNFAKGAETIHIDIDPAEIGKNLGPSIPVVGDLKNIVADLNKEVKATESEEWLDEIRGWKKKVETSAEMQGPANPKMILKKLSEIADNDAILTADVGQNQLWCARNFNVKGDRRFLTSGGLGTMGYSIPAAFGAKTASPDKQVISVMGDGSFQMSMFELGTIAANKAKIIMILFNNQGLGLVREIQKITFGEGHSSGVEFGYNPDFIKIADAYGIKGRRVQQNEEFEAAFNEAKASDGAFLIECVTDPKESTF